MPPLHVQKEWDNAKLKVKQQGLLHSKKICFQKHFEWTRKVQVSLCETQSKGNKTMPMWDSLV